MQKVCIVGYGAIGNVHSSVVDSLNDVELYAICDNNEEKLRECKKKYNDIITYNDFDTMLADNSITSIHICTPHYLHFEMAKKAVLAEKNIIIEKPVTMREKEFDELKNICDGRKNKICIMFQNRTNNCVMKLKELCADTSKIKAIYAAITWHRDMNYYNHDAWRGKKDTEGGGVLINQAMHIIDLISYIGGGVASVKGNISTKLLNIEVEDTADALLKLKCGANALLYATNNYAINSPFRLEVVLDDATYKYENEILYKLGKQGFDVIASDSHAYNGKKYWGNGHTRVISEFYNNGSYTTLLQSENAMKTLFAIYKSADSKKEECV